MTYHQYNRFFISDKVPDLSLNFYQNTCCAHIAWIVLHTSTWQVRHYPYVWTHQIVRWWSHWVEIKYSFFLQVHNKKGSCRYSPISMCIMIDGVILLNKKFWSHKTTENSIFSIKPSNLWCSDATDVYQVTGIPVLS